jgi:AraC family transcriptional regulator of adaptative response/methylated-DNA-[protein]-cysteine methyltransferase
LAVAASERGLCLVQFGDDREDLWQDLEARYSKAATRQHNSRFRDWVRRVVTQIEAPSPKLDIPLDIEGTPFQRQVWQQLQAVPSGTTATYTQIAERIGCPAGARAVALACAANQLAVVIPCHRIVRKDGDLGGYGGGIERKRALLEQEIAAVTEEPVDEGI